MRFERVHSLVVSLALTVAIVGVLALAGESATGGSAHRSTVDHGRRDAATLLLGITDDGLPIARPDDQRDARALGDRDLNVWTLPVRPHLWAILDWANPAIGARVGSRITLAPRGPPPAAASFVNP